MTGLLLVHRASRTGSITVRIYELQAQLGLNLGFIFFGLVFLVLGEIFQIGARLQEEQDSIV